jgi:hypothetical protein
VRAHPAEEPVPEVRCRLDHAAADEVHIGVGEVGRDREQAADRHGLLLEDAEGQRVAGLAVAAHQFRGLPGRADPGQFVIGEHGQPVREEVLLDAGQRGHALGVAGQPAVAGRDRLAGLEQPVHRDPDVPEFPRHPGRPAYHLTALDHAPAEPGAHDHRDRRALLGVGPEVHVVGVERGRVGVVVVGDRKPDAKFQRAADVEPAPLRVAEVRGTLGGDDPVRAHRARRVQAHRAHHGPVGRGEFQDLL